MYSCTLLRGDLGAGVWGGSVEPPKFKKVRHYKLLTWPQSMLEIPILRSSISKIFLGNMAMKPPQKGTAFSGLFPNPFL